MYTAAHGMKAANRTIGPTIHHHRGPTPEEQMVAGLARPPQVADGETHARFDADGGPAHCGNSPLQAEPVAIEREGARLTPAQTARVANTPDQQSEKHPRDDQQRKAQRRARARQSPSFPI